MATTPGLHVTIPIPAQPGNWSAPTPTYSSIIGLDEHDSEELDSDSETENKRMIGGNSTFKRPVFNCYNYQFICTKRNKADQKKNIQRPQAPRITVRNWNEIQDLWLLASPKGLISGKTQAACTIRLKALKAEEILRLATFQSFTVFKKLPPELRNRIWEFAAWEPRVVEMHQMVLDIDYRYIISPNAEAHVQARHFRSRSLDPPLLSTCKESRAAALYRGYKRTELAHELVSDSVYFETRRDILFFSSKSLHCWLMAGDPQLRQKYSRRISNDFMDNHYATLELQGHLRTLAVDASFFLGKPSKDPDGNDSIYLKQGPKISRSVNIAERLRENFASSSRRFLKLRRVVLVLGDNFPGILGNECFKAMRLEKPDGEWEHFEKLKKLQFQLEELLGTKNHSVNCKRRINVEIAMVKSFDNAFKERALLGTRSSANTRSRPEAR
ncbi:hypothetical protein BGZ60DRAFT_428655 [Tricladium varicosporioides]|nr:hypothetical protein BGZ60DRAFT_428655 [Hymenoscyphus varicosporioides]